MPRAKGNITMPVHDWTRVDAGLFHDFHQGWTVALCDALNKGRLPPDFFALLEQPSKNSLPDLLNLKLSSSGVEVTEESETNIYARLANRIVVRYKQDAMALITGKPGKVVAVIEIISPGNKASRAGFRTLVENSTVMIRQGIHLLVIDLFPPGPRDPQGIAKAIWDEFVEEDFPLPPDKSLALAAYDAGSQVIYGEPIAVGDTLPDMPLFLKPEFYVPTPLEATYLSAWAGFPAPLKNLLEGNA
jgi:hypothetical protein